MRRLLENGANTSFINKISDPNLTIEDILEDPIKIVKNYKSFSNPMIPLPPNLYLPERKNSKGYDINEEKTIENIENNFNNNNNNFNFTACSVVNGKDIKKPIIVYINFKCFGDCDPDSYIKLPAPQ